MELLQFSPLSVITNSHCRFAFVKSPRLQLTAKPKLGQREVKLSAVTQWIEKKLCDVVNVRKYKSIGPAMTT